MEAKHESVMPKEVRGALNVQPSNVVVDATIGGAGHFAEMLAALGEGGILIGIDADPDAVERGREVFARDRRPERPVAHIVNDNFRNLERILERLKIGHVDAVLFDLGWSGYQIASPRGFSFQNDEPLLMTYGETGETAADIVNTYSEEDLANLIYTYGEERYARGIAKAIVAERAKGRILTTGSLVATVLAGTPRSYHTRKIHPATKTFQALRIAVNDEIGSLKEGLVAALNVLTPCGRLAVITFHSIEDRVVKNILRDASRNGLGSLTPKKPLTPTRAEILANRRARSAKLRVFERAASASVAEFTHSVTSLLSYVV
ncbi:16S rRNA (cytosine(1402)-N(4))-methyltransferase [Candidatus Kaiserbacteria bacterium RIFCSPHIGHO2_01_FULL_53_31]|uniref:Ribosomal RNA small subunit methyltransferase H n=1 Tax=Candidatus Kaiserbacteria bacterium RIFCSPHIGHO2_01_FULL_53_31 TaxID=1798481 RepID=A0A1F6CK17_9BACT|nr:MAG: 16S rRNA (cytosine(1402)-N(4))-methyltransferase [Candidatus Kaiserbacteria bacterium RIFCSPHIGHO2_01_FULL_53_31]